MTQPAAASPPPHLDPPALRLTGPADLVATVPHLISFVPQESLVVLALSPTGRPGRGGVLATVRVDLAGDPVGQVVPFLAQVRRNGAAQLLALLYPRADAAAGPLDALVDDLSEAAADERIELLDALRVEPEPEGWRWWSYLCHEPRCCPPEGQHVDAVVVPVAEAVGHGLVALPSRSAVEAELVPDLARVRAVRDAVRRLPPPPHRDDTRRCREELAVADAILAGRPGQLQAGAAARLLRALGCLRLRDALLDTSAHDAAAVRQVWLDLTRCAPVPERAAPATLLAAGHLADGGGVRATVALAAALEADPTYRLAGLLEECLSRAVPPQESLAVLVEAAAVERAAIGRSLPSRRT